jgi:flagellar basal body rod protein FlgG
MQKVSAGLALLIALAGCTPTLPPRPGESLRPYDLNPGCGTDVPFKPLARATLRQTGQSLDLAITGEGYFIIRANDGERFRYTRFGQFRITDGRLVTQDGRYRVSLIKPGQPASGHDPADPFPADVTRTEVSADGIIRIGRAAADLQPHGQLQLAAFPNREGLRQVGPGTDVFEETCTSGVPMIETPAAGRLGTVRSGELEEEAAAGASDTIGSPRYHVNP